MKKTIFILASIIFSGIAFEGCQKKGEGDPSISLHGRKARLTGDWELSAGTETKTDAAPSTDITTWSGTSVTNTYTQSSITVTSIGTGSYKLSIVKDGTWTLTENITWTGSVSVIDNTTASGTWNWLGGVGDIKNRSQIIMRTLTQTNTFGSTTTIQSYTGDDALTQVWNIFQLKNKELIVKWEGTSLFSSSTSSSKGEYTFVQE